MAETRGPKRKQATREEFARLMEITHQDVTKLVLKGVLTRGAPIGQWLVEYGRHMKKVAAGWQSDAGFDLIGERARLAAVQADNIALDVARKRADVIPKAAMAEALNFLHGNIRAKLLALPARFRSVAPGTTAAQYVALDGLVREVLTELSSDRFPPVVRRVAEQYFRDLQATAKINGQPVGGQLSDIESGGERGGR